MTLRARDEIMGTLWFLEPMLLHYIMVEHNALLSYVHLIVFDVKYHRVGRKDPDVHQKKKLHKDASCIYQHHGYWNQEPQPQEQLYPNHPSLAQNFTIFPSFLSEPSFWQSLILLVE